MEPSVVGWPSPAEDGLAWGKDTAKILPCWVLEQNGAEVGTQGLGSCQPWVCELVLTLCPGHRGYESCKD
jgi:hypothetical protein